MAPFSFKSRLKSFHYAFAGIKVLFRNEHNAWIHLALTFIVIFLGYWLSISITEWIALVLCIAMVFAAEIFNTAIEYIANYIQPNQDFKIGVIKDLGAAGVVVTAIGAAIIGLIIFLPKIIALF